MSSSTRNPTRVGRAGGLRLSGAPSQDNGPIRLGADVSWLPRCQVGDDQGQVGACAMFAMASWVEIVYGRAICNAEVLTAYRAELRRLCQTEDGLTFPQGFEGAKIAGWLPNQTRICEVSNLDCLVDQPVLAGFNVTPAWSHVNAAGCLPDGDDTTNEGGHAVVIVAHGQINGVAGCPFVYIENSWGLQWGWNGIGVMSEAFHRTHCRELWIIQ